LRLVVLQNIPEEEKLRQEWNALAKSMDRPQVFFTFEWALAVQRAYGSTLHPLLFLAYENEQLIGVAALADEGERISFLTATTGDYCDFLGLPQHRAEFVNKVLDGLRRRGARKITLTNLPADSDSVSAIAAGARSSGFRHFARTAYICAQVSFSRLEKAKDGMPTAPGQKRLRRLTKAVAGEGAVTFDHGRSWNTVAPVLPEFFQAHVGRFLEIGRISNNANAHRRIFLEEVGKLMSASDWLVLSRMKVGGEPVAWHYGFQFEDNWFWYQPTFDSRLEKHWPGFCLLTQVIQDAIRNPAIARLDLGLGSEAYKAKFANDSRETLCVNLNRSWIDHWGTIFRYRLAEHVRTHPSLDSHIASLRRAFRGLKSRQRSDGLKRTLRWIAWRLFSLLWKRDEVIFYEWESCRTQSLDRDDYEIRPLTLRELAMATMEYSDEATQNYLLRSAKRLREPFLRGFVLARPEGCAVHFAWTAPLNGFQCAELNTTLQAPESHLLLFDCWTPPVWRHRGYYGKAIRTIAGQLQESGKSPWIFSASNNAASIQGILQAGFQRRYSLVRKRLFGFEWIEGTAQTMKEDQYAQLSAGI
jgi:CelD/BcsL family acetyltransferase involved in cellulose biosynthesis